MKSFVSITSNQVNIPTVKDKFDTIRFLETFELNVYGTLGEFFSSYKKINKRNS